MFPEHTENETQVEEEKLQPVIRKKITSQMLL